MRGKLIIASGLCALAALAGSASADAGDKDQTSQRIHERRYWERQGERRQRQIDQQQEQQRSRPVPPTGGGSQVVPNR